MLQVGKACRVPSGLVHRALVVPEARLKLAVMVRQLREDLASGRPGGAPVRVIVFAGKGMREAGVRFCASGLWKMYLWLWLWACMKLLLFTIMVFLDENHPEEWWRQTYV